MTCVVGIVSDSGEITIGADSMATNGLENISEEAAMKAIKVRLIIPTEKADDPLFLDKLHMAIDQALQWCEVEASRSVETIEIDRIGVDLKDIQVQEV